MAWSSRIWSTYGLLLSNLILSWVESMSLSWSSQLFIVDDAYTDLLFYETNSNSVTFLLHVHSPGWANTLLSQNFLAQLQLYALTEQFYRALTLFVIFVLDVNPCSAVSGRISSTWVTSIVFVFFGGLPLFFFWTSWGYGFSFIFWMLFSVSSYCLFTSWVISPRMVSIASCSSDLSFLLLFGALFFKFYAFEEI